MPRDLPILYSFRRCPYAMRARLALHASATAVEHREILLRAKPQAMLTASPKGTVPVLVLPDGRVLEESLAIMLWALRQHDPDNWLADETLALDLIEQCDTRFKPHLDRYKYATRYEDADPREHRAEAARIVGALDDRLRQGTALLGAADGLADIAIFPFIRQFAHTDRDWFAAQDWPAAHRWLDRHLQSDRFAAIMQKHPVWTPPLDRAPDK
ncbi:glutathione S-transferase [Maricaulis sp. W15]|uniref:glutathione S-transferase n=1 Tax=Maricaulis sp. W15 TaxID=1772333 RepID=UPI000948D2D9|nr:glutathione S-transferase [Maricaulis sp. W15]OLF77846.1 glutathione S-transferase [Maricaulis sp. W15]